MKEGREFISQGRGLGLKNDEGKLQRPDIILMLPGRRTIIIDSKAPLTLYERLIAAADDEECAECQRQSVRDVRAHIYALANRRYQDSSKLIITFSAIVLIHYICPIGKRSCPIGKRSDYSIIGGVSTSARGPSGSKQAFSRHHRG